VKPLTQLFAGLFDDPDWSDREPQPLAEDVVSDLLPWRLFDPKREFYINAGTMGFMLEISPQVGAEEIAASLTSTIQSRAPREATIQILNWTSPDIDEVLLDWAKHRFCHGELIAEMATSRLAHLRAARFGTTHPVKAIPHRRRVFLAAWIDGAPDLTAERELDEFRRALLPVFGEGGTRPVPPQVFLKLLSEICHAGTRGAPEYTPDQPLNHQLPGAGLQVRRASLGFQGEPELSVASAAVTRFPKEWASAFGVVLNGMPDNPTHRAHGPVLTSIVMRLRPKDKSLAFLNRQRAGLMHVMGTEFAKWTANLSEKKAEFDGLVAAIEGAERLLECCFLVSAYAKGGDAEARAALSELVKMYRMAGITLGDDTYLQLPLFLSNLPFTASGARMADLRKLQRMRLLKTEAAVGFAPIHGEWLGAGEGKGVLLLGRQGGIFDWDNFRSTGNFNVAVLGKSGAGKSVFMQEFVASIFTRGGRVVVIDDGYSFSNTVELFEGKFVDFEGERVIGINPFSMLSEEAMRAPDYRAEAIEMLTRIMASMAALGKAGPSRVQELEESHIAAAVAKVWDEKGRAGEVGDVHELLKAHAGDPRMADVLTKMAPFVGEGVYAAYLKGEATIALGDAFTVVELSRIKGQRILQDVVLQIVMFLASELMYRTPRDVPVALVIDEAWDLLKTDATARFIEALVRRARKYNAALITGTQSFRDYEENAAARVCLENSDWTIVMAQKPETLDLLASEKRLAVTPGLLHQLKSIAPVQGLYSEMAIKGPDGWIFGRLLLDAFSLALFSSRGETVERIRRLQAEGGLSRIEAIRQVAAEGSAR
jgi:conjugal transfer ATP-binding protein TraC